MEKKNKRIAKNIGLRRMMGILLSVAMAVHILPVDGFAIMAAENAVTMEESMPSAQDKETDEGTENDGTEKDADGTTESSERETEAETESEEAAEDADSRLCSQHKEHDADCGYAPATEDTAGSPCAYQCRICPIEDLIDALPEKVTEENKEQVIAALEEILARYGELTEDEQEQVELSRCLALQEQLDAANAPEAAAGSVNEQFTDLTPGDTYWFDLSGETFPGTVNASLPDRGLHWVPFTYAGTVSAYRRESAGVSTEGSVSPYTHSLFIADHALNRNVSWYELDDAGLIFGKEYNAGDVSYILRAPSAGSRSNGESEDAERGVPLSNEWDAILNKGVEIKNKNCSSYGQDTASNNEQRRVNRGNSYSVRSISETESYNTNSNYRGLRPVLEVSDSQGAGGLRSVEIDFGGGQLCESDIGSVKIVAGEGSGFTAPSMDLLFLENSRAVSWRGSDGNTYQAGDMVPASVNRLTAQWEKFTNLTPGETYWFDLSEVTIPGNINTSLPDTELKWVPFTYAGTVYAYKRTYAGISTDKDVEPYVHSLFIADYAVSRRVSWNSINNQNLIFGKDYQAGGVSYTLRAPSAGSSSTGSGDDTRGVPLSNEWDAILNKGVEIKNWIYQFSYGQDSYSADLDKRISRGGRTYSVRDLGWDDCRDSEHSSLGFRPVLEIMDAATLGRDGLRTVELDFGDGQLGESGIGSAKIAVKSGEGFAAPDMDALFLEEGEGKEPVSWKGDDGNTYQAGDTVPASVDRLTAQWETHTLQEQFANLTPGETYWFDLSWVTIPGNINTSLPDEGLHWVPFTYAGTVYAYKRTSEGISTAVKPYDHSLFIADYAVSRNVSWSDINSQNLIFGKRYRAGGVPYTLRAPSAGSRSNGESGDAERGVPLSNEWDAILNKGVEIKNWSGQFSYGQDSYSKDSNQRVERGGETSSVRNLSRQYWSVSLYDNLGFRPVLEIMNAAALGADGLRTVEIDLNGGELGDVSDAVKLAVINGELFTAPAGDGITRPEGDAGTYFAWADEDGAVYQPGATVPAKTEKLTARWKADISKAAVSMSATEFTYNGTKQMPDISLAIDGKTLTENTDYRITCSDSVNAGTVTATIAGMGDYEGTIVKTYTIKKADPDIGKVTAGMLADTLDITQASLTREKDTLAGTLALKAGQTLSYGSNVCTWKFTPDDTRNYNNLTGTVAVQVKDTIPPSAEYRIGTGGWKKFINTVSFGLFCKDYKTVEIKATDDTNAVEGSGIDQIQYFIADKELEDTDDVIWSDYTKKISLDAEGTYFIYVKVTDNAGNETVLNSEGVVVYTESSLSPAAFDYTYKENRDIQLQLSMNGNTFGAFADGEGDAVGADSYSLNDDGTLVLKAAYLDTLKKGEYTYTVFLNPQGIKTDEVTLAYTFTIAVKAKELTVTGVAAQDRDYDGTSNVKITAVTLSGIAGSDDVAADVSGLQGTISGSDAGRYTAVALPELSLTGADSGNYTLVQPETAVSTSVTISPLSAEITVGINAYTKTFGDSAFALNVTDNNAEADVQYEVTEGQDVLSVGNGTVTILSAGQATIKASLPASANYTAAEDKTITVIVNKKSGYAVDILERSYFCQGGEADSIDLAALLPKDCGDVSYGMPAVSGAVTYRASPAVSGGKLSYTLADGNVDDTGTITVDIGTENYADIKVTVKMTLTSRIPVKLKEGAEVTLKNNTLTYGESLSKLILNEAVFVDGGGKTVEGVLAWKDAEIKPSAGTASAAWIFTPKEAKYVPLEGVAAITVKQAVPKISAVPTAADRRYDPSKTLADVALSGGAATGVDGSELEGAWSWQNAVLVPKVAVNGYEVVFTPDDKTNYEVVTGTVTLRVAKAMPYIAGLPAAAGITYGDSLNASALLGGTVLYGDGAGQAGSGNGSVAAVAGTFAWKNLSTKPAVADSGTTEYTVVFTPSDPANYNSAEAKVKLTVSKAQNAPNMPGSTMNVSNNVKKVGGVPLPESWAWQESDRNTDLETGVSVNAVAVYIGADKGSYEKETVTVAITRSACDHAAGDILYTGAGERAPACTEDGLGHRECGKCGSVVESGITVPALGHHYRSSETRKPTTTVEGIMTYTCTRCGHSYTRPIAKLPDTTDNQPEDKRPGSSEPENTAEPGKTMTTENTKLENTTNPENAQKPNDAEDSRNTQKPENTKKPESVQKPENNKAEPKKTITETGKPFIKDDSGKQGWAWRERWVVVIIGALAVVMGIGVVFVLKKKKEEE